MKKEELVDKLNNISEELKKISRMSPEAIEDTYGRSNYKLRGEDALIPRLINVYSTPSRTRYVFDSDTHDFNVPTYYVITVDNEFKVINKYSREVLSIEFEDIKDINIDTYKNFDFIFVLKITTTNSEIEINPYSVDEYV